MVTFCSIILASDVPNCIRWVRETIDMTFGQQLNVAAGSAHAMGTEAEFAAKYPFLSVDANRQAI